MKNLLICWAGVLATLLWLSVAPVQVGERLYLAIGLSPLGLGLLFPMVLLTISYFRSQRRGTK